MKKKLLIATALVGIVVVGRMVPHLPNFTPLAAVALFGGFYLDKRYAATLPIVALFVSDIFLGFHNTMIYVYASMLLIVVLGLLLRRRKSLTTITTATLIGSLLFFLITNFGVWAQGNLYARTLQGLIESYYMGIPFFRNSLLGDIFYATILFGGYEYIVNLAKRKSTVNETLKI